MVDDDRVDGSSVTHWLLLAAIGLTGLLAEVLGLGMVFAWTQQSARSLSDPRLYVGVVLAFVGLFILLRGIAVLLKRIIKILAQPDRV